MRSTKSIRNYVELCKRLKRLIEVLGVWCWGGGDGRDAINCVSTAKHKKGRTRFIKGANMIIIRANPIL